MAQKQSSLLVGVFQDLIQARKAYDDLRNAGFGQDYVGLAEHGQGQVDLRKELMQAGVPEGDASFYEREFKAGNFLITVRAGGLGQEAVAKARDILKSDGAYDANTRRTQGDTSQVGANVKSDESSPYFDVAPGSKPDTEQE